MNYGAISTSQNADESSTEPNFNMTLQPLPNQPKSLRELMQHNLESYNAHLLILLLVAADFLTVMGVILITLFKPEKEETMLVKILLDIAFVINTIFVVEVLLKLFVFGLTYFYKGEFGFLHGFDAVVVLVTFFLEVFLKGKEAEVVELLLLFRSWRLVKVLGAVAVGVVEYDEAVDLQRKEEFIELRGALINVLNLVNQIAKEDHWDEGKKAKVFVLVKNVDLTLDKDTVGISTE